MEGEREFSYTRWDSEREIGTKRRCVCVIGK